MSKDAFHRRNELMTKSLSIILKKRIVKTTWTIYKDEKRRIDALEMWIWRRMEKIAWTDLKTNVEVLEMLEEKLSIVKQL